LKKFLKMFPGLSLLPPGDVGVLGVEGLALETMPMAGLKLAKYLSQRQVYSIVFTYATTVKVLHTILCSNLIQVRALRI
jgi:hypothetical protein